MPPTMKILMSNVKKLHLIKGILYRKGPAGNQLVLPPRYRSLAVRELHQNMGHVSSEKVLALMRSRFYWPKMQRDVEQFVKHQCACVKQKKPTVQPKEELFNISTSCPLELISIDFIHLEQSVRGQEYMMWLLTTIQGMLFTGVRCTDHPEPTTVVSASTASGVWTITAPG